MGKELGDYGMNKQRREKIRQLKVKFQEVQTELKQLSSELSSILNEEQDAFDNIPEGLQSSYIRMLTLRLQDLKRQIIRTISLMWQSEMCHSDSIRWRISSMTSRIF